MAVDSTARGMAAAALSGGTVSVTMSPTTATISIVSKTVSVTMSPTTATITVS